MRFVLTTKCHSFFSPKKLCMLTLIFFVRVFKCRLFETHPTHWCSEAVKCNSLVRLSRGFEKKSRWVRAKLHRPRTHTQTHARRIRKRFLLRDREAMHISGPALRGTLAACRRGERNPLIMIQQMTGPLKEWAVFLLMLMRGSPSSSPAKDAGSF